MNSITPDGAAKYIPGFGESPTLQIQKNSSTKKERVLRISAIAVAVLAGAAAGFLIGGLPGAVIGAIVVLTTIVLGFSIHAIINHIWKYRFLRVCPPVQSQDIEQTLEEKKESRHLGKYALADIRLFKSAEESFEMKLRLIESANHSIEFSPNFAGGAYFQRILAAMEKRLEERPNLQVHLLLSRAILASEDHPKMKELQKKFANRFLYNINAPIVYLSSGLHTEENHVKLLIIDGGYFMSGGTGTHERLSRENLVRDGATKPALFDVIQSYIMSIGVRDLDMAGKSAQLGESLREQFFKLYQIWEMKSSNQPAENRLFPIAPFDTTTRCDVFEEEDENIVRNTKTKFFVSGPEHTVHQNPITDQYCRRIQKAKGHIVFANFLLDVGDKITHAIKDRRKLQPNVEIHGYTNGKTLLPFHLQCINTFRSSGKYPLFDKIYEYNRKDLWYHKKTALFDDTHAIFTSYNHGKKSEQYDHEIAFVVKSRKITDIFKIILSDDKKYTFKHDQKSIEELGTENSVRGVICSWLFGRFL
ncbi:MAG: phospholipase D-like domain-containing protein [Chlamydia sp.]